MSGATYNILILTENFLHGGLETHIIGEVEELKKQGWGVHIACGRQTSDVIRLDRADSILQGLNMHYNATLKELEENIEQLSRIVKNYNINLIHAHPFGSILPGYIVAKKYKLPYITTLHGPASPTYNQGNNFINTSIIASSHTIAISDEVARIAKEVLGKEPTIIRNGVEYNYLNTDNAKKPPIKKSKWLVAARLDQEKIDGIKEFIKLSEIIGIEKIDIAGSGESRVSFESWCNSRSTNIEINFLGYVPKIQEIMLNYDACAGMARVALEAVERARITCLVGYDGVKGILNTKQSFEVAAMANFSGRNLPNINSGDLRHQYKTVSKENLEELRNIVGVHYNQEIIWRKFSQYIQESTRRTA